MKKPETKKKKISEYLKEFKPYRNRDEVVIGVLLLLFIMSAIWIFFTNPVNKLNVPHSIKIEKGHSLKQIAETLKEENIIKSKTIFTSLVILKERDKKIVFGEYLFNNKPNLFEVIERVTTGDYGIDSIAVTIHEGFTIKQIGNVLEEKLLRFDKEVFYQLAEGKEGYLFPDTYFFLENIKAHEVIEVLEDNFKDKIATIHDEIKNSKYSVEEIVIMASIIEREASAETRQEISDILWHRIEIDMPLQVDATFIPINGKGTFDLTLADLKEDNPYNTYVNKGLPPGPISNPGIESLLAAANPRPTKNLYFLTGRDGKMYYAETFEEHKRNKFKYLY